MHLNFFGKPKNNEGVEILETAVRAEKHDANKFQARVDAVMKRNTASPENENTNTGPGIR